MRADGFRHGPCARCLASAPRVGPQPLLRLHGLPQASAPLPQLHLGPAPLRLGQPPPRLQFRLGHASDPTTSDFLLVEAPYSTISRLDLPLSALASALASRCSRSDPPRRRPHCKTVSAPVSVFISIAATFSLSLTQEYDGLLLRTSFRLRLPPSATASASGGSCSGRASGSGSLRPRLPRLRVAPASDELLAPAPSIRDCLGFGWLLLRMSFRLRLPPSATASASGGSCFGQASGSLCPRLPRLRTAPAPSMQFQLPSSAMASASDRPPFRLYGWPQVSTLDSASAS